MHERVPLQPGKSFPGSMTYLVQEQLALLSLKQQVLPCLLEPAVQISNEVQGSNREDCCVFL